VLLVGSPCQSWEMQMMEWPSMMHGSSLDSFGASVSTVLLLGMVSLEERQIAGLRGECELPPLPLLSAWIGLAANQPRDGQRLVKSCGCQRSGQAFTWRRWNQSIANKPTATTDLLAIPSMQRNIEGKSHLPDFSF